MNIKKIIIESDKNQARAFNADLVHLLQFPACVIEPEQDQFLILNHAFKTLFDGEPCPERPSECFAGQLVELQTFTEAVLTLGAASTTDLGLTLGAQEPTRVLVQGTLFKTPEQNYCLFVLVPESQLIALHSNYLVDQSLKGGLLEWKRLESLYKHVESLNELVLTAAGDGIFGVDRQGNTTFVNPAASETLGWDEHDLIGKSMHEQIHHHHSSGGLYDVRDCPIQKTLLTGKTRRVEDEVFWHKSGKPVPVEYISTPIYVENELQGAVIIFRDISERIQTQAALQEALKKVDTLKQRLEHENAYLRNEVRVASNHARIIGDSPAIKRVLDQIGVVGPTNANVLITGESGTGKELVAQAIHDASNRSDRPLIRVNCAAIPKELFESEFFGHVKGAFSGATSNRVGRFELADGGTLFLDEVGEIPIDLQGKLLRVLQDRKYERVGEGLSRETDVRLIAATNRNLEQEVKEGRFREDLFFRLNVFPIHCAPLRERLGDIPDLARHFIRLVSIRSNLTPPILDPETIRALQNYDWPGNARELQNVIERGTILAQGGKFTFESGQRPVDVSDSSHLAARVDVGSIKTLDDLAQLERALIVKTLEEHQGRVSGPYGAARALGINPQTLYSRLRRYGIKN